MPAYLCPSPIGPLMLEEEHGALTALRFHPELPRDAVTFALPATPLLRQAAAVLVAVITAFALLHMTSPTVQAAVNSWICDTFGIYIQYAPAETTPPDAQYDYALPEDFDGYTLLDVIDNGDGKLYLYVNEQGQMLKFQYIYGSDTSLFLDVEDFRHQTGKVGECSADIYIAPNEGQNSAIIWYSQDTNTLFHISAAADADTLVNLAQSVKIK